LIFLLVAIVASSPSLFQSWKQSFGKTYHHDVEFYRYNIWKKNLDFIENHNQRYSQGLVSFDLAMNQFGDLTNEEFGKMFKNRPLMREGERFNHVDAIPDNFDWRDKGVVPPVVDQGQCGSAVIYAEVHAIESINAIAVGEFQPIDINQISACLREGCDGVIEFDPYKYVMKCGAPFTNYPPETLCQYDTKTSPPVINGFLITAQGNEIILANSLYNNGPHSVAIDASQSTFQFYSSGIYYDPSCSSDDLDHVVQLVGYGINSKGDKFWIIKNSWGVNWGLSGYMDMSREKNNNCGIATLAAVPTYGNDTYRPDQTCFGPN